MYKVIDNFLDIEVFDPIFELLVSDKFPWYMHANYLYNNIYLHGETTEHWLLFEPIVSKLPNLKRLIRIKTNMYPRFESPTPFWWHCDSEVSHNGCIIGINSCNGGLAVGSEKDHVFIPSIANQCILFDPGKLHSAVACSDQNWRININVNWE